MSTRLGSQSITAVDARSVDPLRLRGARPLLDLADDGFALSEGRGRRGVLPRGEALGRPVEQRQLHRVRQLGKPWLLQMRSMSLLLC